jgi:hypothetical protein
VKAIAVALALLDFAPIFFLALGLVFLAQLVERLAPRCRRMALVAVGLVSIGVAGRALSNLIFAFTGEEEQLLSTLFYVFGGPGFALMAESLLRSWMETEGKAARIDPWIVPSAISWIFLLGAFAIRGESGEGPWRAILISLFLGGSAVTSFATGVLGWKRRLHMAAGLLLIQFAGTVIFISIRAFAPQHPLIQLLAELMNLAAQAAFAFACWRVAAEYHARIGPTAGT